MLATRTMIAASKVKAPKKKAPARAKATGRLLKEATS